MGMSMKNNMIYRFSLLMTAVALAAGLTACDSFLDRQEDETMTFEKIWQQRDQTQAYFFNVMGYLPDDSRSGVYGGLGYLSQNISLGASDESDFQWANSSCRSIYSGSWGPGNMPDRGDQANYAGIRDANIFLQNVLSCSDPRATQDELQLWYNCARWARAYFYFLMMRDYGPVILLGDEVVDSSSDRESLARPRNTWDECVDYVVSEMEYCAKNLPASYNSARMGLPTRGAALAVISRLRLYSARDLFNGNSLYRGVLNPDGTPIFPREFSAQKWAEAARAAKVLIDGQGELGYELYHDEDNPSNPYLNYYGIFQENWNKELIYCGGGYRSRSELGFYSSPSNKDHNTYAGWGVTQQQVDAYAMANGRYPITGYQDDGKPRVDAASGYNPNEFMKENFANPFLQALGAGANYYRGDWPVMYKDREPRFYVNVFWGDSYYMCGQPEESSSFYKISLSRGSDSYTLTQNDYSRTGYFVHKWTDHLTNGYVNGWGAVTFPTFRLGEIYLNYIESVLECEKNGVAGEGVDHDEAMRLWDELRARSGMASVTEAYPGASTAQLIDLVRKERRVELAHEGHRHYDTRTWMVAKETDGGPMYGMDISVVTSGTVTPDGFWNRTVFDNRMFRDRDYLWPFAQSELERNLKLVQNYGW